MLRIIWINGVAGLQAQQDQVGTSLVNENKDRSCYLYSLFNGTNTLTTSIVTQQTINVNSTALTINGQLPICLF
jgi:hypothetical protein